MRKEDSWMATYSGKKFYPFNPDPSDVDIKDIVQSLSSQCRYNGHTDTFYSVAQHSILVCRALLKDGKSNKTALIGLIHDAGEAYISDVPSPIKRFIPELEEIEDRIFAAVLVGLGVPLPTSEEWSDVMEMDRAILAAEGVYMTDNVDNWTDKYISEKTELFEKEDFRYRHQSRVKNEFIELFNQLKGEKE